MWTEIPSSNLFAVTRVVKEKNWEQTSIQKNAFLISDFHLYLSAAWWQTFSTRLTRRMSMMWGPLKVPMPSSSFKVGKINLFNTSCNDFQQLVVYLEYTTWKTSSKSTAPTTLRRLQLPFTNKDDVSPHTHLNFSSWTLNSIISSLLSQKGQ